VAASTERPTRPPTASKRLTKTKNQTTEKRPEAMIIAEADRAFGQFSEISNSGHNAKK
jgi:hypothetical protein